MICALSSSFPAEVREVVAVKIAWQLNQPFLPCLAGWPKVAIGAICRWEELFFLGHNFSFHLKNFRYQPKRFYSKLLNTCSALLNICSTLLNICSTLLNKNFCGENKNFQARRKNCQGERGTWWCEELTA